MGKLAETGRARSAWRTGPVATFPVRPWRPRVGTALVYVLVPYTAGPANVSGYANRLLEPHAQPPDGGRGWYDYLCRPDPVFDDPITEGALPDKEKRALHRYVCDVSRLPSQPRPHALVTPDGAWPACAVNTREYQAGRSGPEPAYFDANAAARESWPARYAALLAAHPYCWVVAVGAHL